MKDTKKLNTPPGKPVTLTGEEAALVLQLLEAPTVSFSVRDGAAAAASSLYEKLRSESDDAA